MTPEEKEMCAQWWADRLEIKKKRKKFKLALINFLHDDMMLYVDYDPRGPLLDALHEIGIECRGSFFSHKGIFPAKTGMNIRQYCDDIKVKEGYGGDWEKLEVIK